MKPRESETGAGPPGRGLENSRRPLETRPTQPKAGWTSSPALGLGRRAAVEGVGTAFLLTTIVGSGIMGERLSGGNAWQTLLVNSLATGASLVALTLAFRPLSGAHLNPAVTLADAFLGNRPWREARAYILAQLVGAFGGVAAGNAMFGGAVFSISSRAHAGPRELLSELVATAGLVTIVLASSRFGSRSVALAVGSYIAAAYWFASSTSFANPAVALGRSTTNSFVGIRPADVPGFVFAELLGGVCAAFFFRWLVPPVSDSIAKADKASRAGEKAQP